MDSKNQIIAVITGDVIDSTRLAPEKIHDFFEKIRQTLDFFDHARNKVMIGQMSIFSGDSWQFAVNDPKYVFRLLATVTAVAKFHKISVRLSAGVGSFDYINPSNITESGGEAFIISGRELKKMEKAVYKKRHWHIAGDTISMYQAILFDIMGKKAETWTPAQAEAILLSLQGDNDKKISSSLGIKRQNAGKRLTAAQWDLFQSVMDVAESE